MATLLIPAKGVSSRVENKNLRLIGNRSLLERAIEDAQRWEIIDEIFVATDTPEIAEFASIKKCQVFRLNDYDTNDKRTVRQLWKEFCQQREGDQVLWHATNPFRNKGEMNQAWEIYKKSQADIVFSVKEERHLVFNQEKEPMLSSSLDSNTRLTQNCDPYYVLVGSFVISNAKYIRESNYFEEGNFDLFPVKEISAIDIDYPQDLLIADSVAKNLGDYWSYHC